MRLDERLLEDYRQTFDVMSRLRMNEIVSGDSMSQVLACDIKSAVTPERGAWWRD